MGKQFFFRRNEVLSKYLPTFRKVSTSLWGDIFANIDRKIYIGDIKPKHGSGTTAERIQGNRKYDTVEWTDRLEKYFPAREMLFSSYSLSLSEDQLTWIEPGAERPVRVVTVPKTLKTPRIIAIEPVCMQYVQQGLLEQFEYEIENANHVRDFIYWDDQTPNQELARLGSLSGELATLDLSEASDRVSNLLVRDMFRNHPHLQNGVESCRSNRADVLGKTIKLSKFASMGSALCFPIEAMVFLTIVFAAISTQLNVPFSRRLLKQFKGRVRVYGDDIIVPVEFVSSTIEWLEAFGLQVNRSKSFWTGKFRESCGKEYYDGHDVSIVRLRSVFPTSRAHATEVVSTVSLRNQLFWAGYVDTVEWLDQLIERLIPFPIGEPTAAGLVRHAYTPFRAEYMHPDLQIPMVKGMKVKAKIPLSQVSGRGALMKFFLRRGEDPFEDRDHLLHAGRSVSLTLKHGWIKPF